MDIKIVSTVVSPAFSTSTSYYHPRIIALDEFGRVWERSLVRPSEWSMETPQITKEEYEKLKETK
jgi:hypothetical protein